MLREGFVPGSPVYGKGYANHCGEKCQEDAVSVGEDGANPSRCRHCKRGVTLSCCHCVPSTWEGAGKR